MSIERLRDFKKNHSKKEYLDWMLINLTSNLESIETRINTLMTEVQCIKQQLSDYIYIFNED